MIAEAGVNHNGDLDTAIALIRAAVDAGADAVKFQTFDVDHLVTLNAEKAVTIGTDAVPANLTVKGDVAVGSASIAQSTGNISTPGLLTANTIATSGDIIAGPNKVVLDGSAGDLTMQGQLTVVGGFAGDLNLLNNKVTNLADPAAATDAANRKYVDSKVVAFSIALG